MQRHPIESSAFVAVGYDPNAQVLEIEFHPNKVGKSAVWQYSPVVAEIAEKIADPNQSAGKVFFSEVKASNLVTAICVDVIDAPTTGAPVNVKPEIPFADAVKAVIEGQVGATESVLDASSGPTPTPEPETPQGAEGEKHSDLTPSPEAQAILDSIEGDDDDPLAAADGNVATDKDAPTAEVDESPQTDAPVGVTATTDLF